MEKELSLNTLANVTKDDPNNCNFLRAFATAYVLGDTQNKEIMFFTWKCLIRKYKLREKYK